MKCKFDQENNYFAHVAYIRLDGNMESGEFQEEKDLLYREKTRLPC